MVTNLKVMNTLFTTRCASENLKKDNEKLTEILNRFKEGALTRAQL